MRRLLGLIIPALVLSVPVPAQQPTEPADAGLEERVQVTLVQIDALVVDKDGKTVLGLTNDDFRLQLAGRKLAVSTVDFTCPIGATADPLPLKTGAVPPAPIAPGVKRKVVFAFDYSFLAITNRAAVLDVAAWMLGWGKPPDEEVMIVALTNQVRVEQKFTTDLRRLTAALNRMKYDVTLWPRDFPVGVSGQGYFGKAETLMDVLASYPGPKAVIYFSEAGYVPSAMGDLYYNEVAAHAAAGRTVIYPTKPGLMEHPGPESTLSRLANESGGRMPYFGNDMSLPYRRAQRDLLCRYTVGAYVDPKETVDPRALWVQVVRPGLSVRAPEQVKVFTADEMRRARANAAYVDPGPFERPLVRAYAYPAAPVGSSKWDTLLAVNFPAPVGSSGADLDVLAAVRRDNQIVREFKQRVHVDPAAGEADVKPVTILKHTKLAAGTYDLTVVLAGANGEVVSAQTDFVVPPVVPDVLTLSGPIFGRVVAGGQFFQADADDKPEPTRLGQALGPDDGFEPMLVGEIDAQDKLLFYWSACVYGDNRLPADAVVTRTFSDASGAAAHAFAPVPLQLTKRGKGVSCLDMLESVAPGTLRTGDYKLDVTVKRPDGTVVTTGTSTVDVR